MRKVHRVAIGPDKYEFTQLGGIEGMELFHDLRKAAMPALARLHSDSELLATLDSKTANTAELVAKLDGKLVSKLGEVVVGLLDAIPKPLERELRAAFARTCNVGVPAEGPHGKQTAFVPMGDAEQHDGIFDQHFSGRPGAYLAWMLEGLKFNFAGFLGDSGSGSAPVTPATPSP